MSRRVKRITPAYAGKRQNVWQKSPEPRDHPRLCGEKSPCRKCTKICGGSPPPMRGKETGATGATSSIGITPAYAGKSSGDRGRCNVFRDHPRLCGEKWRESISTKYVRGSPPPMRGKGMRTIKAFPDRRITPAYAGKSMRYACAGASEQDHPRLCGEKVDFLICPVDDRRITPAYAGKSFAQPLSPT